MAQFQRVEGQVELKCHADKLFEILGSKPFLLPKISPHKISKFELHEGDNWDKVGAVYCTSYVLNGRDLTIKAKVEEFDRENRKLKYSYPCHDEFILKNYYKTLKGQMHATTNGNKGCIMKLTFEYEKVNEDAPPPNMYIDFVIGVAKDVDSYVCRA